MKILLTANASYFPPQGGSTRSNLAWLETLAAKQHSCQVVSPAPAKDTALKRKQVGEILNAEGMLAEEIKVASTNDSNIFWVNGVQIHSVTDPSRMHPFLVDQIRKFKPNWILVSSEDLGQALLKTALQTYAGRVIYLAHTPQVFPFGPASLQPNPAGTELLRQTAAIVAIGQQTAEYIQQYTGIKPVIIHPPIYSRGPFLNYGRFSEGFITIVNPCAVKGISIFLTLAQQLSGYEFAALPGWGTTDADRKMLEALPNVQLLNPCKNIDEVLARTRILLVPSLWQEGFGLIVVEAMLRGIPVLASNFGGLLEAKLDTDFLLPVRPIEHYESRFDEHRLPNPIVPEQDIIPWLNILHDLLSHRTLYEQVSKISREAALAFVSNIDISAFEQFLESLTSEAQVTPSSTPIRVEEQDTKVGKLPDSVENLSHERRTLLALRLLQLRKKEESVPSEKTIPHVPPSISKD